MSNISTLGDYVAAGCPSGDFLFKSGVPVRGDGANIYRVPIGQFEETLFARGYIQIGPVNGKPSELKKVHVLIKQHLDDPPREF